MTLMIALVGEQTLPNFLPVLHRPPSDALLLYTERTKPFYERLAASIKRKKTAEGQQITVHQLKTDPFDILAIAQALATKLQAPELIGKELLFNLTGGTKAMSFAAYQIAQQKQAPVFYLQSEGRTNYLYHYTWHEQQLLSLTKEILPECIELHELLDLQFGIGKWREAGPDLNKQGGGGIFEKALADALRPDKDYELMTGVRRLQWVKVQKGSQEVEELREVMEIDIIIRYQNQYGIIEAKVGPGGGAIEGIRQLILASRQLGTYTYMFYAITVPPTPDHEEIRQAFSIRPISLPTYERGRSALTAEETSELIKIIADNLKSPQQSSPT